MRQRLFEKVETAVGSNMNKVLAERALARDVMGSADVERIRDEMEKAEARKLQPHFIRTFFEEAFQRLGGHMVKREPGRYEVKNVPADVRQAASQLSALPVLRRYERITFDKESITVPGKPVAEFVCPGHPLLDATIDVLLQRHRTLLRDGAILVAEADPRTEPRALVYLEHAIQDGRTTREGQRRVVSKRFEFVEAERAGEVQLAGYAPYLDYRPIAPEELELIQPLLAEAWLSSGLEAKGMDYAIERAVPAHLEEVRARTLGRLKMVEAAVRDRLTKEINYWDHRADQLKDKELAGKGAKGHLNSGIARQRAEELAERLKRRLEEIEQERQISAQQPVIVGGALVVPAGYLASLRPPAPGPTAIDTTISERIAVNAVMAIERELGREPEEQDHFNPGFDILSKDPITGELLFIEVKGRAFLRSLDARPGGAEHWSPLPEGEAASRARRRGGSRGRLAVGEDSDLPQSGMWRRNAPRALLRALDQEGQGSLGGADHRRWDEGRALRSEDWPRGGTGSAQGRSRGPVPLLGVWQHS